jgi:hypothetical protein
MGMETIPETQKSQAPKENVFKSLPLTGMETRVDSRSRRCNSMFLNHFPSRGWKLLQR